MNKKILTLTTAFACSLFMACSSDSSSASDEASDYTREFATSIAAGETMFIGTMSMDHIEDLGTDFIEVGTRAGVVYFDGSIFVTDLDKGSITRYALDEYNKVGAQQGQITLAGAWANHLFFVDKNKGYIGAQTDTLYIFDPQEMKITGGIDLTEYKDSAATAVTPGTGVIVDGRLYIGLLQNMNAYATGNQAQVAIIDVETDSVIAVAKDDRVAAVGSLDDSQNQAFVVTEDYIYTYCNASWGYAPGQVDGFLRIKIGETEFDEDYEWLVSADLEIDGYTEKGNYKYFAPFSAADGNVVYGFLNLMVDMKMAWNDMDDYYAYTMKPVKVNLAKKTVDVLPIDYTSSWAAYGKYIEDAGTVLFAVSTEEGGNMYLRYDPSSDAVTDTLGKPEQIPMWLVPLK
ncbi:MAG: hypothetical protein K6A31_01145 [Fibrobacter sp.]|nr:hypothetical protein [Fibrobacter sp.]